MEAVCLWGGTRLFLSRVKGGGKTSFFSSFLRVTEMGPEFFPKMGSSIFRDFGAVFYYNNYYHWFFLRFRHNFFLHYLFLPIEFFLPVTIVIIPDVSVTNLIKKLYLIMFSCDGLPDHAICNVNEVFNYWDTKLSWFRFFLNPTQVLSSLPPSWYE